MEIKKIIITILIYQFYPVYIYSQDTLWNKLNHKIFELDKQCKYAEVLPIADEAFKIAEKTYGKEHPNTINSIEKFGDINLQLGKYKEAEIYYKRAYDIKEKIKNPNDSDIAISLNNIGNAYFYQGRFPESEEIYKKGIQIIKRAGDRYHSVLALLLNNLASSLESQTKYNESEEVLNQALEIRKKIFGSDNLKVSITLNSLANLYCTQERYNEAEERYKKALQIRENLLEKLSIIEHPILAPICNNLGNLYELKSNYREAESYFKRALEVRKKTLGETHPDLALSMSSLAKLYENMGRVQESENLLKKALEIRIASLGKDHPLVASILNNLANLYFTLDKTKDAELAYLQAIRISDSNKTDLSIYQNNLANLYLNLRKFDKAENLYKKSLDFKKQIYGENHFELAGALNGLASLYESTKRYEESELLFKQSLGIREKAFGKNHIKVASSLISLANYYYGLGKFEDAGVLYERALSIKKSFFGGDHLEIFTILNNIALANYSKGKIDEATIILEKVIEDERKIFGDSSLHLSTTMNNLGTIYDNSGNFSRAEDLYRKALSIRQKAIGIDNKSNVSIFNNLANLLYKQGKYIESEPLFDRALKIYEILYGKNDYKLVPILNNLAVLYYAIGKVDMVEPILKKILKINEDTYGKDHVNTSVILNNLASFYYATHKTENADQLLQRVIAIREKSFGENHPYYANILINRAEILANTGNYSEAESLLKQAIKIKKKSLGEYHYDVGSTLNKIGGFYYQNKKYLAAEPYYKEDLNIYQKILRKDHPFIYQINNNLAKIYIKMKLYKKAEEYCDKIFSDLHRNFNDLFNYLSEKDKIGFLNKISDYFSTFYSLAFQYIQNNPNDREITKKMFDLLLWHKGSVVTSQSEIYRNVMREGDEQTKTLFDSLKAKKEILAKYLTVSPEEHIKHKDIITNLSADCENIEKDLVTRSSTYAKLTEDRKITWKEIQNKLKPGEALIEIIGFNFSGEEGKEFNNYIALIISPDTKNYPEYVSLGSEENLLEVIYKSYQFGIVKNPLNVSLSADNLHYRTLWKPFEKYLKNIKKIFISPDGVLNNISFGTFVDEDGRYLIDKYDIQYLSISKDLLKEKNIVENNNESVLFGYPDYNLEKDSIKVIATKLANEQNLFCERSVRSIDLKNDPLTPLLSTKSEVEEIGKLLKKNGLKVRTLIDKQALEEAINMVKSPKVLHIATHGFFLTEQDSSSEDLAKINSDETDGFQRFVKYENPMLRSGLFFAGANNMILNKDVEDGILTAYESANLNLYGTELVVLSACNTGLGKIKVGEGVFGLRRAFQLAGAESIIMSLWPVPDKETQELMIKFYTNWFNGMSKPLALQNAQKEIKEMIKKREGKDIPFYWGAFILVGN